MVMMTVLVPMVLVPFACLALLAASRQGEVLFIDGEAVLVKNGMSEQMNRFQIDGFHLAAGFADQVPVTVFRLA